VSTSKTATLSDVWADLGSPVGENSPPVPTTAPRPIWQQSLLNQVKRPSWPAGASIPQGLLHNLGQARQHGQDRVNEQDAVEDLKSDLTPGYRLQRSLNFLNHGDRLQDPVDQALFRPLF
jgi:hypothetical protein